MADGPHPQRDALDWGALVPRFIHPTKLTILEALQWLERPLSPRELERLLDDASDLSALSYHVKSLRVLKVIEETHNRQVCGSNEHYFYFTDDVLKPRSATGG